MENSILKKDIIKSGVIESLNERFGQWKQAVKARDKAHRKSRGKYKAPKQGSIKSRVKKGVGRVPLKDVNTPEKKNSIQRVGGSRGVHTANRKSKAAQGKQAPVIYSYKKKVSEGVEKFDKLVKSIKGSDVSKDQSVRLLRIAGKVRKIKESRVMNSSSIEKSGPTIDVKATEVKDKKKEDKKNNGAIVKSKGSDLANRGNKNTEVKDKRDPKPYRDSNTKKNKGKPINWKNVRKGARKGAEETGKVLKKTIGAVTAGYGQSSFSEEVSRRHKPSAIKKKAKLEKALSTLKLKREKMRK